MARASLSDSYGIAEMSRAEAQDLIQHLMQPCADDRIALSDVKCHRWTMTHTV
jgi:hypothetical protein